MIQGPRGHTYLNEGEEQAHGEVGEPVDAAPHHEGGWPGGLQEDLGDEQRGDGTLGGKRGSCTPRRQSEPPKGAGAPAVCEEPRWGQSMSGAPCPVQSGVRGPKARVRHSK